MTRLMTARNAHPDADRETANIVTEINNKGKAHDQNLSNIAQEIYALNRHNPGIFKDEMKRINSAFQDYASENGLGQLAIVSSDGTDLTTRSVDGKVQHRDGMLVSRFSQATDQGKPGANPATAADGTFEHEPDGSAKYKVKANDTAWSISAQRLKDAGVIDDQTDTKTANNLIANYVKEASLEHKAIHAHDLIDLPPVQIGGDGTAFGPERQQDRLGAQAQQQQADLAQQQAAHAEETKNLNLAMNAATKDGLISSLTPEHISNLLGHPEKLDQPLTKDETAALQYVQANWDHLQDFQTPGFKEPVITHNSWLAGEQTHKAAEQAAQENINQTYLAMRGTGADL